MKTLVGIDNTGNYEAALNLLSRLAFDDLQLEVVHVNDSNILHGKRSFGFASSAEIARMDQDDSLILGAEMTAKALGFATTRETLFGSPPKMMVEHANRLKADIVAIGSRRRSKFNSSLFGSVGRALTISGKESLLIAKGTVPATGPISVVLTTDHSKYSDRAIKRLIAMSPNGIGRLVLLTAFDKKLVSGMPKEHQQPFLQFLEKQSKKKARQLKDAGYPVEYRLWEGDLGEVVEAQMDESNAELLIMGAQGHGYSDRLLIGSSALKQVVSSRHSILLLRP